MVPSTRALVTAAAAAYAANCALGTAVALRAVDTSGYRWLHHLLFVVTASTTAVAGGAAVARGSGSGVLVVPALLPLALLPFLGHRVHARIALAAAPWYAAALAGGRGTAWN